MSRRQRGRDRLDDLHGGGQTCRPLQTVKTPFVCINMHTAYSANPPKNVTYITANEWRFLRLHPSTPPPLINLIFTQPHLLFMRPGRWPAQVAKRNE